MTRLDVEGEADHPPSRQIWWFGWSRESAARLTMTRDVVSRRAPVLGDPVDGVAMALPVR